MKSGIIFRNVIAFLKREFFPNAFIKIVLIDSFVIFIDCSGRAAEFTS